MLFINTRGNSSVGFKYLVTEDACSEFESTYEEANSFFVNGVKVRGLTQCIGYKKIMLFAYTDAGRKFITNEFSKMAKVNVTIDGIQLEFSALSYKHYENVLTDVKSGI